MKNSRKCGFTLIELLVVLSFVAIIALVICMYTGAKCELNEYKLKTAFLGFEQVSETNVTQVAYVYRTPRYLANNLYSVLVVFNNNANVVQAITTDAGLANPGTQVSVKTINYQRTALVPIETIYWIEPTNGVQVLK